MKHHIFSLMFILSAFPAFGKTSCLFFVGDGSFFKPQIEKRFTDSVTAIKKNWKDCDSQTSLIGSGRGSYVYDSKTNHYRPLDGKEVEASASKANLIARIETQISQSKSGDKLRLYLGDHGHAKGTGAIDGIVGSKELRSLMKKAKAKGILVESVFSHCYSGNMLESLYDAEKNEVYGCGISSANNKVSYTSEDMKKLATISKKTSNSQVYYGHLADKIFMMSTSDRFLYDYARARDLDHGDQECSFDNLSKYGFKHDDLDKIAHHDTYKEIEILERNYELAKENAPITYKNISLAPRANEIARIQAKASEIHKGINEAFLDKIIRPSPAWQKHIKRKAELYENLVDCRDRKIAVEVNECPDFKEYSKLNKEYNEALDHYKKVNVAATVFKDVKTLVMTLKQYEAHYQQKYNEAMARQIYQDKLNLFTQKKLALLHMIKTNNTKALKAFTDLITCERRTSL